MNEAAARPNEGRRGIASSSSMRTRRRLVTTQEDEAPPRLPAEEGCSASSQQRKTKHCLAFQQKNEAAPHPSEGRRGDASACSG
ncbi:hypothetical protein BHE74_00020463 [Ensete ventricosum]|nr:hypothetical protein BHE74_00020463 [Ensete ventricosum]